MSKPPHLPPIFGADPDVEGGSNIHASANNKEAISQKWFRNPDWWVVIFTGLLVFVGIATAKLLLGQLAAANKAVTTAQGQLEATDRPWLKVDFTPDSRGFYFRDDGTAELTLRAHIKNIGHSVATGVIIPHEMFLPSENGFFSEPVEHQRKLCDPVAGKNVGSADDKKQHILPLVIFPGDADESQSVGFTISKASIDATKDAIPQGPGFPPRPVGMGKNIIPLIVGCVDYEFGTSDRHHQTGFIYQVLRHIQVPANVMPFVMIDITKQVSPADVVLMKYGFGGFDAN